MKRSERPLSARRAPTSSQRNHTGGPDYDDGSIDSIVAHGKRLEGQTLRGARACEVSERFDERVRSVVGDPTTHSEIDDATSVSYQLSGLQAPDFTSGVGCIGAGGRRCVCPASTQLGPNLPFLGRSRWR
jgi:hypothetical protein